jgi:hypothetical protein
MFLATGLDVLLGKREREVISGEGELAGRLVRKSIKRINYEAMCRTA